MTVSIEAGTLKASVSDRTVSGLLLPYNERCSSSIGKFSVPKGAFTIPSDPSVITLNVEHDAQEPIGRALSLTDTDAGILATFGVAKTPEGDKYLSEVENGTRNALSAEVKQVVVKLGKAVSGALFGAACVEQGAFPSATLLAAYEDALDVIEVNGVRYARVPDEAQGDGEEPATEAAEAIPAVIDVPEDPDTPENDPENKENTLTATAAIPASLAPKATAPKTLFAALAEAPRGGGDTLLAALAQTNVSDVSDGLATQWRGEVSALSTYVPRFADLVSTAPLAGLTAVGFRVVAKPTVGDYAGAPNAPVSSTVTTEQVTLLAHRIAGAVSIDRGLFDLPAGAEVHQAVLRELIRAHDVKVDEIVRTFLADNATQIDGGSVPAGTSAALAALIDGVQAILNAERSVPSFAVVGADIYRDLLLQRTDDVSAHLGAALGIQDGTLAGFKVRSSNHPDYVGKVLVGTSDAVTRFTLAGAPVRLDVASIQTGSIEQALFSYSAELLRDASGLVQVTPGA